MAVRDLDTGEEQAASGTPDDVAILYAWANLHGAKYRDFSASRREYRAQIRYRAAKTLRERELTAQAMAESSAIAAERAALAAEQAARSQNTNESQVLRLQALRGAEAAARKAAAERVEAARRGEAAAQAEAVAKREEREIAEAHASAQRQARSYTESEARRRQLAGPQPDGAVPIRALPAELADPYTSDLSQDDGDKTDFEAEYAEYKAEYDFAKLEEQENPRQFLRAGRYDPEPDALNSSSKTLDLSSPTVPARRPEGYRPDDASGVWDLRRQTVMADAWTGSREGEPEWAKLEEERAAGPAWLFASQMPPRVRAPQAVVPMAAKETLQDSRERVAARWFALKGVFEHAGPELPAMQPIREGDQRLPLLLVFSLAGGVGKTSMVATLGRVLSSLGEKVVLTDTTAQGLLPYYFGARELRAGVPRSFSPPKGSKDAPLSLVSYALEQVGEDERRRELMADEILRNGQGNNRVVLDLSAGSSWLIRKTANLHPTVLVPMTPDMNSVIGMQAVEKFFQGIVDSDGRPVLPFYVLNQFDATLPLHLDVREVFRRQLGDRLLSFVIRRSPAVSEALAEGMTVVDYAAEAPVAKDYRDVAEWLRTVSPPATGNFRQVRWSEA